MALAARTCQSQPLSALLAGLTTAHVPDVAIRGVAMDSRQVRPGDLFLACAGAHQHGLEHAHAAIAAGAAAVAWDAHAAPQLAVPNVYIEALSAHIGTIAARAYGAPAEALFVTGITGTDGKTSCAHLLAQALDVLDCRCGYMGTLGYGFVDAYEVPSHTTPDAASLQGWLARLRASGAQAAALEVSSHALAQQRVQAVAFDVAVLTHIGRDHLDYHGDMAHYAAAKRRLFDMPGLGCAVLNADDAHGREWLKTLPAGVRAVAYGLGAQVDATAAEYVAIREITAHAHGLTLKAATSWGDIHVNSTLVGRFNGANLAAVLAVLLVHGVAPEQAAQGLAHVHTVPGRMQQVSQEVGQPLVVVDYAHTPDALAQALQAVGEHASGRIHCVFGCGGERDRGKRPLMGAAAATHADVLWVTNDNPRGEAPQAITDEILVGFDADSVTYTVELDRVDAITHAIKAAQPGDAVLIAGKGHEGWQQIGEQYRRHDDRVVARRVLEAA